MPEHSDAGPVSALTRRELALWAVGLLLFRDLLNLIASHNVVEGVVLIAWGCAVGVLWRGKDTTSAGGKELGLILACAAAAAFARDGVLLATAVLGIIFVFQKDESGIFRRTGVILLALVLQKLWAKALAILFYKQIVAADVAIVGWIMHLLLPGTQWSENTIIPPDSVGVFVGMSCSSFANITLVILCYTSLAVYDGARFTAKNAGVIALICGAVVMANTFRLILTARSLDLYHYWHDAAGAQIFSIGMTAAIVVMCSLGAQRCNAKIQ